MNRQDIVFSDVKIRLERATFSEADMQELSKLFNIPLVRRFLQHLMSDVIIDASNMPVPTNDEEEKQYMRQQIFSKGHISILNMLLSIEKIQPSTQQSNRS